MAHGKLYRSFIILQEDERGHSTSNDKPLSGYAKVEAKGDKCKIAFYAQNLKADYGHCQMVLVCNKKDGKYNLNLGPVNISPQGKAEMSVEYDANNIGDFGVGYDKIVGASLCKEISGKTVFLMCGFLNGEQPKDNWKNYKMMATKKDDKKSPNINKEANKNTQANTDNKKQQYKSNNKSTMENNNWANNGNENMVNNNLTNNSYGNTAKNNWPNNNTGNIDNNMMNDNWDNNNFYYENNNQGNIANNNMAKSNYGNMSNNNGNIANKMANNNHGNVANNNIPSNNYGNAANKMANNSHGNVANNNMANKNSGNVANNNMANNNWENNNNDNWNNNNNDNWNNNSNEHKHHHHHHNSCCDGRDDYESKFDDYEREIDGTIRYDDDNFELRGSMGEFFNSVVDEFDLARGFTKDIKNCKWYKVKVNDFDDMCNSSNYNKYTVAYYPMINYYPYIAKHGHFMLGLKCDNNGVVKYVVYGIPGTKDKKDQPYGGKTGFVTWSPDNRDDGYGHWLMFYDFQSSMVVVPMK